MTTDHIVVNASSLPPTVRVGDHLTLQLRAHVRRIEAEEIDVRGFEKDGANAVLHGEITVELTIEKIGLA